MCLPTGLGKTFIAAVVMYNYYRWFPEGRNTDCRSHHTLIRIAGKVIFMAPSRQLVAQQMEACYDIMGIPQVIFISLAISPSNDAILGRYSRNDR